jgi:hypothetical protein
MHSVFRLLLFVLLVVACGSPPPTPTVEKPSQPPQAPQAPQAPPVQGPKLAFVDEGTQDPSLVAYRDRLLAAVRARDAKTVLELSDPGIRTSFGGTGGRADLGRKLEETPELWRQLETILTLGGTFRGEGAQRSFWAPYVYSAFPDSHDAFATVAVIADEVPLRERPAADAPVVALLSHDLLAADFGNNPQWIEVKTADGKNGWVERRSVRSPVDYRAGFMKTDGTWKMMALVAGD